MSIVAALDKVLFFNASSKYSVLRMKTEDSSVPAEARSPYRYHDHLIRFTAVGIELPRMESGRTENTGSSFKSIIGRRSCRPHWRASAIILPPVC